MADLILNVDFAPSERPPRKGPGNPRHRRFLQRQRQRRAQKTQPGRKAKPPAPGPGSVRSRISTAKKPPKASKGSPPGPPPPHRMVAIDCEMVGTGPRGRHSALARCSVVGYGGEVLYDRYVRPTEPIVDYRTRWSGIRPRHMAKALPFSRARREVVGLLAGKVVVGHSVENDFRALQYQHPPALTRDTSTIPLLNLLGGFPQGQRVALRKLTRELLHRDIQVGRGGHSSVEDAQATMELYRVVETEWEQHLLQTSTPPGGAH